MDDKESNWVETPQPKEGYHFGCDLVVGQLYYDGGLIFVFTDYGYGVYVESDMLGTTTEIDETEEYELATGEITITK